MIKALLYSVGDGVSPVFATVPGIFIGCFPNKISMNDIQEDARDQVGTHRKTVPWPRLPSHGLEHRREV